MNRACALGPDVTSMNRHYNNNFLESLVGILDDRVLTARQSSSSSAYVHSALDSGVSKNQIMPSFDSSSRGGSSLRFSRQMEDIALQQIIELSDLSFPDDEPAPTMSGVVPQNLVFARRVSSSSSENLVPEFKSTHNNNKNNNNIEEAPVASHVSEELDDLLLITSCCTATEEVPVAAALVKSVDLFWNNNNNISNTRKRSRDTTSTSSDDSEKDSEHGEDGDDNESRNSARFRNYQEDQWSERFQELCEYREKHGHCMVPHNHRENPSLARWVKRQRNQYKRLMGGAKLSTMTSERLRALEEIGFVWNCQGSTWEDRVADLRAFREKYHHCNVPTSYPPNPRLAMWVKCQRRQYKLYVLGEQSSMTPERIQELDALGFSWGLRNYKRTRRHNW